MTTPTPHTLGHFGTDKLGRSRVPIAEITEQQQHRSFFMHFRDEFRKRECRAIRQRTS